MVCGRYLYCLQLSAAGHEKLAAQDAVAEQIRPLQQKLTMAQQEIDMLRSAAEIEVAVRREMEETAGEVRLLLAVPNNFRRCPLPYTARVLCAAPSRRVYFGGLEHLLRRWYLSFAPQLRRALDATADELASVTGDKANLDQHHHQAQESIDALVAELQDTLARLEQEQQQAGQLSEQLKSLSTEGTAMQKQVGVGQYHFRSCQARPFFWVFGCNSCQHTALLFGPFFMAIGSSVFAQSPGTLVVMSAELLALVLLP